ncbi:MAG TPA: hypothetical protein PLS49_07945 [Candidatus Woesebacteria bacterium]|nr:hypothetical protein [Candidatus Woesebacteria bacterium]
MFFARDLKSLLQHSFLIFFTMFVVVSPIFAQGASIATYFTIDHPNVLDGYIVAAIDDKFVITSEAYQPNMIGIVNKSPAIEIRFGNTPDSYPVTTSGRGMVMVSLANGNIKKGDYITASPIEGVGMKATIPGSIIGVALEDASSTDESTITKIQINIQKDYNVEPFFNLSGFSSSPFASNTTNVTKYIMGGGVLILTLVFSFMYFGRLSMKGVEALGRNPLASKKIHVGIILNVTLAIAICIIGFITAIYIIRF